MTQELYNGYVPMHMEGITHGTSLRDAYVAVLRADDEDLLFPILLEKDGYEVLHRALEQHEYTPSHLMLQLAERVELKVVGVRIKHPADGRMMALIDFAHEDLITSLCVPAAEALVAALEAKTTIYVLQEATDVQRRHPQQGDAVALPLTAMSVPLLEQALENAVQNDEFELASVLRDELRKRQ